MIFKLYSYAQSYPWPKQWLREALSCYEIKTEQELEQAPFIEMTVEYGKQMVKGYLEQAEHYHELCQDVDGPYMYEEACEQDVELMEELLSCSTYQDFYEELGKCKFATLGRAKDYIGSPEKQEQVKTERKKLKDGIGKLKSDCFALTFQEILEQLTLVQPSAEALAEVTERLSMLSQKESRIRIWWISQTLSICIRDIGRGRDRETNGDCKGISKCL